MPRVLIVEDDPYCIRAYIEALRKNGFEFAVAESVVFAEKAFCKHDGQFAAVIMDACLDSSHPNTLTLTRKLREEYGYEGPIVAASGSHSFREKQMQNGCDVDCDHKMLAAEVAIMAIRAQQKPPD